MGTANPEAFHRIQMLQDLELTLTAMMDFQVDRFEIFGCLDWCVHQWMANVHQCASMDGKCTKFSHKDANVIFEHS